MAGARRFRPSRRDDVSDLGIAWAFADVGAADTRDIFFRRDARRTFVRRRVEGALPVHLCVARFRCGSDPAIVCRFCLGAPAHKNYWDPHSYLGRIIPWAPRYLTNVRFHAAEDGPALVAAAALQYSFHLRIMRRINENSTPRSQV